MVETCCCGCIQVRTGTMVIAVLDIIAAIINFFLNGNKIYIMFEEPSPGSDKRSRSFAFWITVNVAAIILAIVYAGFSILLLIGAIKHNYRKCLPWLYWSYCFLGATAIYCIVYLLITLSMGRIEEFFQIMLYFAIYFVIYFYFINVVDRFIDELKAA